MERITAARLREVLDYDHATGLFQYRRRISRRMKVGAEAGSIEPSTGYVRIGIDYRKYGAHQLAWLYVHGCWPRRLDHRNQIKTDNRIANLREATVSQNAQNIHGRRPGRSGVVGVAQRGNRWVARIRVDGRLVHLGNFDTRDEAAECYAKGKRELHPFSDRATG